MKKRYELLRQRMARFNAWEANERKSLTAEDCLRQFLILYDLAQFYPEDILRQTKEDHLMGLVKTNAKLRKANIKSI